jgi:hypothetical protein
VRRPTVCATLSLVALAVALPGCGYLRNRGRDAAEMFDVGLTFSKKPQLGLYMNCPVIAPIGYGKVDATYAGVGGGKVGVTEHQQRNAGLLLWGRETNTWTDTAGDGSVAGEDQQVGVVGLAGGPSGKAPYKPACKHYFHLGWIGMTANVRWLEIPDFLLGWVGVDISRDDLHRPPVAEPEPKKQKEAEHGS